MKALITGAPVQIEGEPAEIAQLVELLTSGRVLVEHVHRWRIDELDGSELVKGRCWCGLEKDFNPHTEASAGAFSINGKHPEITAATHQRHLNGNGRKCRTCGQVGHRKDKCPQRIAHGS
jgi:hypothetical protein